MSILRLNEVVTLRVELERKGPHVCADCQKPVDTARMHFETDPLRQIWDARQLMTILEPYPDAVTALEQFSARLQAELDRVVAAGEEQA